MSYSKLRPNWREVPTGSTRNLSYYVAIMARCVYCKVNETELYEDGSPVCPGCAELTGDGDSIRAVLVKALSEATMLAISANAEHTAIMSDIPSGLPHSDGVQRIRNASAKLAAARCRQINAHARLTDYLDRGIVPEDL